MHIALFSLLVLSLLPITKKEKLPDLIVLEIREPDWDHPNKRTTVEVVIQNIGKAKSTATYAKLYDIDPSSDEAKKWGLEDYLIEALEENDWQTEADSSYESWYDEDIRVVRALDPGEKITLNFYFHDHWVYDPNCELECFVDFNNLVKESNKDNNKKVFVAWG